MIRGRLISTLATAALCAAVVVAAAAFAGARGDDALLLPDLVQDPPRSVAVRVVDGKARLGFSSAVTNSGAGPLTIEGRRRSRLRVGMTATQVVARESGRALRRPGVGLLRYTRSPDHSHWHYLRFDRYELRVAGGRRVVADRKTGFCLGDRYEADLPQLSGEPAQPPYRTRCGLRRPDLLKVTQGISVGYGDFYQAYLEGQYVDITGVPAGRYELVHHANADRHLLEERYDNNTSCVGIDLTWTAARPAIALSDCAAGDAG